MRRLMRVIATASLLGGTTVFMTQYDQLIRMDRLHAAAYVLGDIAGFTLIPGLIAGIAYALPPGRATRGFRAEISAHFLIVLTVAFLLFGYFYSLMYNT